MGVKISNDISSDSTHQIHFPKIMHTPGEGLYQSCSKNCEISNFGFLAFFFVLLFWGRSKNVQRIVKFWTFGIFFCSF